MTYQEPLSRNVIAVSISESPDMGVLGLGKEHLDDAMAEVARHLLAMGARLLYGGDLRPQGFSELLFELVARHRRDADVGDERVGVSNIMAWPVHASLSPEVIEKLSADLAGVAELICLTAEGQVMTGEERKALSPSVPNAADWGAGLTNMRRRMAEMSDARVVMGGRVEQFKGRMPGVAEEALISLEVGQPLFILGGFGGCARDIVDALGFEAPIVYTRPKWIGQDEFNQYNSKNLNNGLSFDENQILAKTAHVDQAVTLILRGLFRRLHTSDGT